MADITLTYKGAQIASTSASGTKTLKTAGKYCESDIVLNYVRPSGEASASIVVTSEAGATLTCGSQTYQLGASETTHTFTVALGTYTVTATKGTFTKSTTVVADVADASYPVSLTNSRLPDGYTELTYIESTGTQYIDTNVKIKNFTTNMGVEAVLVSGAGRAVFGVRDAYKTNNLCIFLNSGGIGINQGTVDAGTIIGASAGTIYEIHNVGTDWYINGEKKYTARTTTNVESLNNAWLFGFYDRGTPDYNNNYRVYSAYIETDGVKVRDFVPCIRMSDGEVGMYDLVAKSFFGNSGTGVFVGGEVA